MQWVTREHPKIDRLACPWLIRRFIDPTAEILYVPPEEVVPVATHTGAIPFDVPNVKFSHQDTAFHTQQPDEQLLVLGVHGLPRTYSEPQQPAACLGDLAARTNSGPPGYQPEFAPDGGSRHATGKPQLPVAGVCALLR